MQKPLVVVVVGASGDLARKKTYPSLYELYQHGLLPPETVIWGYARTPKNHLEFRDHLHVHLTGSQIPHAKRTLKEFLRMCYYHHGSSYGDSNAYQSMLGEITDTAAFDAGEANVLYCKCTTVHACTCWVVPGLTLFQSAYMLLPRPGHSTQCLWRNGAYIGRAFQRSGRRKNQICH
jgi:glucose-6-phosphate 1-dehydrogenase